MIKCMVVYNVSRKIYLNKKSKKDTIIFICNVVVVYIVFIISILNHMHKFSSTFLLY